MSRSRGCQHEERRQRESHWDPSRPEASTGQPSVPDRPGGGGADLAGTHPSLQVWAGALDPVSTFDNIGLEADRTRSAVELQKEAAGIAEHRTSVVTPP